MEDIEKLVGTSGNPFNYIEKQAYSGPLEVGDIVWGNRFPREGFRKVSSLEGDRKARVDNDQWVISIKDDGRWGSDCTSGFLINVTKQYKGHMNILTKNQEENLSKDAQALIKAGYWDSCLTLTELGKQTHEEIMRELSFPTLVSKALKKNTEEEARMKKEKSSK